MQGPRPARSKTSTGHLHPLRAPEAAALRVATGLQSLEESVAQGLNRLPGEGSDHLQPAARALNHGCINQLNPEVLTDLLVCGGGPA